ncbi:hypothetical protein [Streptomyces kanasensis]|uniref:hypothetical protein n=1 Tax=Streptomyces kanasensis TaxID=936756 RepID=UPI0036FB2386
MSGFEEPGRREDSAPRAAARTAQDKAAESAGLVGEKAAEVAGTAKEQAAGVAHEATTQARDVVGELRGQLQEQAHTQTRRLADNVRRLADELREMSDHGKPDSGVGGVVRQISDGGHQVASRLEDRGPDGLVDDLRDFARRRPGVFLAGAALAGFVVARAGKGVSAAGSSASDGPSGTAGPTGTTGSSGALQETPAPYPPPPSGLGTPTGSPPVTPTTPTAPAPPPVAPPVVPPVPPSSPNTPYPGEGGLR